MKEKFPKTYQEEARKKSEDEEDDDENRCLSKYEVRKESFKLFTSRQNCNQ
ncbi:hypothetical protein CpipJ_CPIJ004054 [Culex quinquefasciatus]|uniref:Uncharacterized protein n=1 Tax=Culex quinquefasciatus TaxID=7176 RepID=B0WAF0_CULQU|nr:hypothetical protein CpipJ_CPIJ004054 [Culex quinquefasciatus]|eukprot:XP_001845684.1 hypothetical protein CpipJ_CPIJ004054 [Culex quinquefasciatus]